MKSLLAQFVCIFPQQVQYTQLTKAVHYSMVLCNSQDNSLWTHILFVMYPALFDFGKGTCIVSRV